MAITNPKVGDKVWTVNDLTAKQLRLTDIKGGIFTASNGNWNFFTLRPKNCFTTLYELLKDLEARAIHLKD